MNVSAYAVALQEWRVARIMLNVTKVGLADARVACDQAETAYLAACKLHPRDRDEELRTAIVLGDAKERLHHWIGIALRAQRHAGKVGERPEKPHERVSCLGAAT